MVVSGTERLQIGERLLSALLLALATLAIAATTARAADPVIAAAGDIACASSTVGSNTCHHKATSDLLVNAPPAKVLVLGDAQYDSGSLSAFKKYYHPTWGRLQSITAPAIGNHENSGSGYYDYFGRNGNRTTAPGNPSEGFYSFDVGTWHLIALNSNCSRVACDAGSEQAQWLRADLAAHPNSCKLAFWHHPRFSSGHDHDNTFMQPIWQALYEGGVDVALTGHSHDYERFWPMNASGGRDDSNGITEFVVGTGGAFFTGISTARPNSAVRNDSTYGVLKLTLHPTSYDWEFVPEAGETFTDSGSDGCGGAPPPPGDTQPPSPPTNLTATAPSLTRVDLSWGPSSDNVAVTGYEVYRNGALIASPTGTSYTDSTVNAGTTYTYQVKARDARGNRSASSNDSTVMTPGTVLRLPAQADARVEQANPASNFGTGTASVSYLRADSSPGAASYLRFNVIGVSGTVESAKLRVYAQNDTDNGPAVQSTTSGWSETELTWNNRPAPTSAATDDKGTIVPNTWVEYDVKPFVTGSGTYSFILAPTSSNGVEFASREYSDVSRRPQLVLTVTDTLVDNGQSPDTAIIAGPTGTTNSPSASFGFSSSESPSVFECKLDSGGWTGCSSPQAYTGLAKGSHTFRVRATDQFGNTDSAEATRSWTVVYLPSASLGISPSAPLVGQPVTFMSTSTVVGTDTITKNEWDLDGNGSFETNTAANPSATRSYLVAGPITVSLRVTDNDGDTSVAARAVSINLPPLLLPGPFLAGPLLPPSGIVADRRPPALELSGPPRKRLRGRSLTALIQCDEACTATASAGLSAGRTSAMFHAKPVTLSLAAGARTKLKLRFSKKAVRSIRRLLARRKHIYATVRVVTRDRAGNLSSASRKIRLKR